eukprot:g17845.t1
MSASYLEVQFSGLGALYTATGGEEWTSSTGWLDNALGVCSWHGVTCDSSGQNVTALSLAGNGLAGDLADAAELFDVLSLVSVDLSNNELVGAVMPGFGLMPGLEVLDLSRNELSVFPASWGAEAWSLQQLSLQLNNISGTLPSAWIADTSSSTSHPLVHSNEVSSWLPELRTLALGGNNITMPAYDAIQSVIGFASLQVLDLSGNALSGNIENAFDLHYCEGGSLGSCDSIVAKTGASDMAIVLLASNRIEGRLDEIVLPGSVSVLTVSDNLLHGPVPDDFSQLSVFLADGNEGLNDTALPSFASYINSSAATTRHGNLSCPVISGQHQADKSVHLSLDPSYLGYSHCVCGEGMEGAESVSQCRCDPGFYDTLEGTGGSDGAPSCSECPFGGVGWEIIGATSVAACSCPVGWYLDEVTGTCVECEAGTYKASVGNDASLCVPCMEGSYSSTTGGTHAGVCIPCEAGTYSASSGAAASSACLPCPAGTFSPKEGLFSAELCGSCPAGYYSETAGATDSDVCLACPQGKFSSEIGASSRDSCEPCPDGLSSLGGSHACELQLANSRRWLSIYLLVGASTLTGICVTYYTWQKKVHKKKKLIVDRRTDTPLKMTEAKRKAHMWAVFFHTLETIDVITGNALFAYLQKIGAIQGFMQVIYWLAVSMGVALNVFRIYMILWMKWMLVNVSVAEKMDKDGKKMLEVHMPSYLPGRPRTDRRIMTPDDAKMVLELVKILKHLQINKFKVQLAVVMDLPLTILNLWLLWMVEPELIKSALFLTSLIIAVFSAGKISTLIEYHLELRQRKRKLERLLLEDECFEHGQPETLLKFHGKSMRNIATTEAEHPLVPRRKKRRRYLKLSPSRRYPKGKDPREAATVTRKLRGAGGAGITGTLDGGEGGSPRRLPRAPSPMRSRPSDYAKLPRHEDEDAASRSCCTPEG